VCRVNFESLAISQQPPGRRLCIFVDSSWDTMYFLRPLLRQGCPGRDHRQVDRHPAKKRHQQPFKGPSPFTATGAACTPLSPPSLLSLAQLRWTPSAAVCAVLCSDRPGCNFCLTGHVSRCGYGDCLGLEFEIFTIPCIVWRPLQGFYSCQLAI
jgi:hypothetical protein